MRHTKTREKITTLLTERGPMIAEKISLALGLSREQVRRSIAAGRHQMPGLLFRMVSVQANANGQMTGVYAASTGPDAPGAGLLIQQSAWNAKLAKTEKSVNPRKAKPAKAKPAKPAPKVCTVKMSTTPMKVVVRKDAEIVYPERYIKTVRHWHDPRAVSIPYQRIGQPGFAMSI